MLLNSEYIKLSGINLSYGAKVVLHDVNLTVNRGDFMAVTGPNGGGKTSLIRIMLGLLKPSSGIVKYYNKGVEANTLNVGYLPQKNSLDLRFPISIEELVASGLTAGHTKDMARSAVKEKVSEMLESMELSGLKKRQIGEVSGGQFQRALLARAAISGPELLALDEPTSYLDEFFENRVFSMLERLSESCTIVIVSHDTSRVKSVASRIISVNETVTEQL